MARIKFYQGTETRNEKKREYFSFRGGKFGDVGNSTRLEYAPEYAEFKAACEAGKAPQVDDSGEFLKIVPQEVEEKKEKKGLLSKGKKK